MFTEKKEIYYHIAGVLVVLLIPLLFTFTRGDVTIHWYFAEFLSYLYLILFFYLNFYLFLPQLFFKKKYWQFAGIVAVSLVVMAICMKIYFAFTLHGHMPPPRPEPHIHKPEFVLLRHISHNFTRFFAVLFISYAIKLNQQLKKIQNEKLQTELSYLRAQINPHFLFNTLNSIYALAIDKSDETANAVVTLSGMMRFVVSDAQQNEVSLEKELKYIEDYIHLQKLRIDDRVKLNFHIKGERVGKKIAPMLLIPFIENAFKYGVNAEENSVIDIEITIQSQALILNVVNNKVTVSINPLAESGIGLENTKNRLELLYPNSYSLRIDDNTDIYKVQLALTL